MKATKTYYRNDETKIVYPAYAKKTRQPLAKVVTEQLKNKHIQKDDVKFFKQLILTARQVATKEFLPLRNVKSWKVRCNSYYGRCNQYGDIKINITFDRHYSSILNTLAHELAHLKFMHHYQDFWNYQKKLILIVHDTFNKVGERSNKV
jgi:predicted metal-dependent hydrolase|tara:strand:- start:1152 stop:1598 length:447 start_codon:yes stop_codon:yes gene_type:complete